MKEYWVNVYDFSFDPDKSKPVYSFSRPFESRTQAREDCLDWGVFYQYPIYRVHVKMKPVEHNYTKARNMMDGYRAGY